VQWTEDAIEALDGLDNSVRIEIVKFLEKKSTLTNPGSSGKALIGNLAGLHRYRVGKYRIIVKIKDDVLIVLVLNIAHRANVYKGMYGVERIRKVNRKT
jgi:mRNA interferase RelE/StbE